MSDLYIIECFIHSEFRSFNDIFLYNKRFLKDICIKSIQLELTKLIKKELVIKDNNNYKITLSGRNYMNINKNYYSEIIYKFMIKYSMSYNCNIGNVYELKEKREEQQTLRNYLVNNRESRCIICSKNLPLCLLETAHIKPRCILNKTERLDKNIVEFMCRFCHKLYDSGLIAVNNCNLEISNKFNIENFDLDYQNNTNINKYNNYNKDYFNFHYKFIFNK